MNQDDLERVAGTSPNLVDGRMEALRDLIPQAFTEGRIDFERLRAALGDVVDDSPERYSFSWAGKRDAMRLLQMPTRATLVPAPEESLDWDTTANLFIEGENLETLKLLLRPYYGRVKMVYIDPPYNTGNDFIYPDDYRDPLGAYLQQTGQVAGQGDETHRNRITSGRRHSAWLSMMYPRLWLARQLLRDDGVIFVSIDDNEVHNLRLLMDEVFGEEKLLACAVWKRRQVPDNRNLNQLSVDHEYVLAYGKGDAFFRGVAKDLSKYSNPDDDPRGPWMSDNLTGLASPEERPNLHYDAVDPNTGRVYPPHPSRGWICEPKKMRQLIEDGRILFPSAPNGRPRLKRFLSEVRSEFTGFSSVQDAGYTTDGTREAMELFGDKVLPFPKPTALVRMLCEQTAAPDEPALLLDFFAGSCTTAQAVLALNREDGGNRRFIMVQLPEPTGRKDFPTIAEIGKERIRRVVARMKAQDEGKLDVSTRETPEDLGFRVFKLAPSNYRNWGGVDAEDTDELPGAYARQMELFTEGLVDGWEPAAVIAEVAVKEAGFGLGYSTEVLGEALYRVTDPDAERSFYLSLANEVRLSDVESLGLNSETLFVCRATALDDTTAGNLQLQCRLKVI